MAKQNPERTDEEKMLLVDIIAKETKYDKQVVITKLDWDHICRLFNGSEKRSRPATKTELLCLWRSLRVSADKMRQKCGDEIRREAVLGAVDALLWKRALQAPGPEKEKPHSTKIPSDLPRRSRRKLYSGSAGTPQDDAEEDIITHEDFEDRLSDSRSEYLKQMSVKLPKTKSKGSTNVVAGAKRGEVAVSEDFAQLSQKNTAATWASVLKTVKQTVSNEGTKTSSTATGEGLAENYLVIPSSPETQSPKRAQVRGTGKPAPSTGTVAYPPGFWRHLLPIGAPTTTQSPVVTGPPAGRDSHVDSGIAWNVILHSDSPTLFPVGKPRPETAVAKLVPNKVSVKRPGTPNEPEMAKKVAVFQRKPDVVGTNVVLVPSNFQVVPKALPNPGADAKRPLRIPCLGSPRLPASVANLEKNDLQMLPPFHTSTPKKAILGPASPASAFGNNDVSGPPQQIPLQQPSVPIVEKSSPVATSGHQSQPLDPGQLTKKLHEVQVAQATNLYRNEVQYQQQLLKQSQVLHEARVANDKQIAGDRRKLHEDLMRNEEEIKAERLKLIELEMANAIKLVDQSRKLLEAQLELEAKLAEQKKEVQNANLRAIEASVHFEQEKHLLEMEAARLKRDEAETRNKIAELKLKKVQMEMEHSAILALCSP